MHGVTFVRRAIEIPSPLLNLSLWSCHGERTSDSQRTMIDNENNATELKSADPQDIWPALVYEVESEGSLQTRTLPYIIGVANLRDADLSECELTDADLRGADLKRVRLVGANLRGADLRATRGLTKSQLHEAVHDGATRLPARLSG